MKKFDWVNLHVLGLIGVIGGFYYPSLKWFMLFFLLQLVPLFRIPHFLLTYSLSLLNPFILAQLLLQNVGQFYILLKNRKGFPAASNYQNKVTYHLPFRGKWLTYNGGTTPENSHSWAIFTQRYAYDFVMVNAQGISHQYAGQKLDDYYCWEQDVLSPADGVVVQIKNTVREHPRVGNSSIDWRTTDFRGNFIIIRHHPNEYSFITHFKKGSIRVKEGESVSRGQVIAQCGNSGHSTEPHIHFHLQDRSNFWLATGLPIQFSAILVEENGNVTAKKITFIEKQQGVLNQQPSL